MSSTSRLRLATARWGPGWWGSAWPSTTDLTTADERATSTLSAARTASVAWERARAEAREQDRVRDAATAYARLIAAADDHAADAARLEAGRRAEGLRPLARLVDERTRRLSEAATVAEAALAEATAAGLDAADLPTEVERLSHEVSVLTLLLPAEQRLADLRARRDSETDAVRALQRDEELARAEATALTGLVARLSTELDAAAEAQRSLPAVEADAVRIRSVVAAHADASRLEAEVKLATVDHSAAVGRLLDLREHLLDVRERRIAGMAAELAGALAVGNDCPVCGSIEHPHPAAPAAGHPDAAAERQAQKDVDDAQALEHALALRVREVGSAVETARGAASVIAASDLETTVATAERSLSETRAHAARHGDVAEQLTEARRRVVALDDESGVRRVRTAELTTSLEHLRAQAADLDAQVAEARGDHPALAQAVERLEAAQAKARRADHAVTARAAARSALDEAELALGRAAHEAGFDDAVSGRRSELTAADLARLEELVRNHRSQLAAAEAVLAEPGARELLDAPVADLEALETAHRAATAALEQARAAHEVASRRHLRVAGLTDELRAAFDVWAPVREQLELATSVSTFAEGRSPDNRLQMRLSAYVLAYRLTQVVAAANARLAGMSDQRYSLEHVGERGAGESRGGLSLVVRDDWSGECRDPATLSGGETFVVSLALALGLADVVAHEAGGADLATLFVDEGFGSLDAETLDDVLDILDTLRENGRAVGVVSHVAEMRDRIPTQLVVTKARTGSTLRISR